MTGVGVALRRLREACGLTIQQAADAAFVGVRMVVGAEAGDRSVLSPRFVSYLSGVYARRLADQ